jgi:hypothetical protein
MNAPQAQAQPTYDAPQMQGGQSNYQTSSLNMSDPGQFGQAQASQYMSPYAQNVIDSQINEATRDAQKGQLSQNLAAASQGTYGGSRQLLAQTENQRNLSTQLGNIQATGMQNAYQNAQTQYNADRAAQMQTGQANQSAGLQQQQMGMQQSLANLTADQQTQVQNQAAQLQTQGLNAQQAMQTALANQQSSLTAGQANLSSLNQTQQLGTQSSLQALLANQQANLQAQQGTEQSNQFAASNALAAYGQAGQQAQTLGNLGATQQQTDSALLNQQLGVGDMDQALQQQSLDTSYQDYLRQQGYPLEMLQQYSSLLRGVPVTPSDQTTYSTPTPSAISQILGTGVGALGVAKALG